MANQTMNRRELHPAVSISSWLIFAIAVELAAPRQLPWLVLAASLLLFKQPVWQRLLRLVWKAKWLWIAIMLLYAITVPGVFVWPGMRNVTYEGLEAGGLRVVRLLALLAALARLLEEFGPQQLAGGLYQLARPLDVLGFDRRALAVRLALTIEFVDGQSKSSNWLDTLKSTAEVPKDPEEIRFSIPSLGFVDAGLLAVSCILLGVCLA